MRNITLTVMLMGLLLTGGTGCASQSMSKKKAEDEAAVIFIQGLDYAEQGRLSDAETEFRNAAKIAPWKTPIHHNLGTVLMDQGRFSEADDAFRRAINTRESAMKAVATMQKVYAANGSEQLAESTQTLLDDLGIKASGKNINDGNAAKHEKEAREELTEEGKLLASLSQLGKVYLVSEENELAEACYRFLIDQRGDRAGDFHHLAVALDWETEREEAKSLLKRAINLEPENIDARGGLGSLLVLEGDLEGGEKEYRTALKSAPGNPYLHAELAAVLLKQGRKEEAEVEYKRAIENGADDPAILQDYNALAIDNRLENQ